MYDTVVQGTKKSLLVLTLAFLVISQLASCSKSSTGSTKGSGGSTLPGSGGQTGTGGQIDSGEIDSNGPGGAGQTGSGGQVGSGGHIGSGGQIVDGGQTSSGGQVGSGGQTGTSAQFVVAMIQSSKPQATDITQTDVVEMVTSAITQAGGLDFIKDGQTVVLKPNLVSPYANYTGTKALDAFVNGITTDWRVVKAVADLVRAKNPTGKILVMEGSVVPTAKSFSLLGYTPENFGSSVDEFLGFEGASCSDRSTDALVQKTSADGKTHWLNKRYASAEVVISLPTLKTHSDAGITGGVKNLGIGTTPVGQYSVAPLDGGVSDNCTRGQSLDHIDHSSPETLGQFIHDYYSLRPADFVVMDGLQGLQNGPNSLWSGTNYKTDKMNMRLIMAGKNAVAVDTIEALVMKCDPTKVPHLTKLEASGIGTTDITKIAVVGNQVSEVAKPFAGKKTDICPGK
jgi:uncharacterized protein (DUF362 family)